jgi:hypothetical protein
MPLITASAMAFIQIARWRSNREKTAAGPLDENIVDAHGHQVDPHRIVPAGQEGDFEFGAHAVGGTDQDRLFHLGDIQRKQAAKPADIPHDTGTRGRFGDRFDAIHQAVGFIDIHAASA